VAIAVVVVAAVAVAGGVVILVTDDSADVLVDTFSRADRTGGLGQAPSGPTTASSLRCPARLESAGFPGFRCSGSRRTPVLARNSSCSFP
jgi:hypothetical protein